MLGLSATSFKWSEEGLPSVGRKLPTVNPCKMEKSVDGQVRSLKTEYRRSRLAS